LILHYDELGGKRREKRSDAMPATAVDTSGRGGQVVTVSEAYEASIAIRGEKIVAIGPDDLLRLPTSTSMPQENSSSQARSTATSTSVDTMPIIPVAALPPTSGCPRHCRWG
jgi:hypothetical protein